MKLVILKTLFTLVLALYIKARDWSNVSLEATRFLNLKTYGGKGCFMRGTRSYADILQAPPTHNRSHNKTLQEIMMTNQWEGGKPAVIYQAMWRGLIKRIAQLEREGITHGVLDPSQISIYQVTKVTILNDPIENDISQGSFKEQMKILSSKAFDHPAEPHTSESERVDFLKRIRQNGNGFRQLEFHPFLLSYEKHARFLLEAVNKFDITIENWKFKYKTLVSNYIRIQEAVGDEKGYSDVYQFKDGAYEDNALGALLYSRNVVAHIEEYFEKDDTSPSDKEVGKRLSEFFPEMMIGLYKFIVKYGIEIESEPGQIDVDSYIS